MLDFFSSTLIFGVSYFFTSFNFLGRQGQELTAWIWSRSALPRENGDGSPLQVQCQDQGRQWIWTHGENSLVVCQSTYWDIYFPF